MTAGLAGDHGRLASVAVPTEHGGWSFTLEPAILGLLVAPTWPGAALALAGLVAFLMRTPLKVSLVDRRRGRRLARTMLAEQVVLAEALVLAVLLAAAATGEPALWVPVALAVPLGAVGLWHDARSRSRRLLPELAGTVALGALAAGIVLAAGEPWPLAAGLWALAAGRAVATVPFVRVQLRRFKGQPHRVAAADAAQAAGVAIGALGWLVFDLPAAGAAGLAVLGALQAVAMRRAAPRAAVIGAQQVVLGLTLVVVTGLAVLAP